MKIEHIINETTTAGAVSSVAMPLGKTVKRTNETVKGLIPAEKVMKAKKKGPYANSLSESKNKVSEAELQEDDLIIIPGQGMKRKNGFIPQGKSRVDHEVEMAKSDLLAIFKNTKSVMNCIKDKTEDEGLEGWVQEKIIKASDYMNTIAEYLESKRLKEMSGGVIAAGGVGESTIEEGDLHSDFGDVVQKVKREWEAERARERQAMSPRTVSEPSREELERRLGELESEFDPAYQYSDDYSFWTKQNAIAREIASIKKKLGSQGVSEGEFDQWGGEIKTPPANWKKGLKQPTSPAKLAKQKAVKRQQKQQGVKQQGVAEGYSLKKTNVSKYMEPGDTDEYTQDINIKDTDYEIINNKTGQVVGTASWTTNDYFGPGALKITMKNGATRWLDIYPSERGNPQTAFNRFVKDPKTAKKYKEEGVAEGSGAPEITPGMKTQYGTVVSVNGNTVTVKTSNGELTTVNIHDIQQGVAEGTLTEKAKSTAQQKFFGMAHAMQKGKKIPRASKELKDVSKTMSKSDVKDFAKTKHKDLPSHVKKEK